MIDTTKEEIKRKLAASPITIIAVVIYVPWTKGMQTQDSDLDMLIISMEVKEKSDNVIKVVKKFIQRWFKWDLKKKIREG